MADILIVAATSTEAGFLSGKLKNAKPGFIIPVSKGLSNNIDVLITGAGMVATTYHLTKAFVSKRYQLAINIGICGSLNPELKPVRVVNIITDEFGDFGAEDGEGSLDAFELGFNGENQFPFQHKKLNASFKRKLKTLKALPAVNAVTLQKSTGSTKSRKKLIEKFNPDVESMEGAGFFYVCQCEKIKCLQVRAISNIADKRNREKWMVKEAVNALEGISGLLLMELDTIQL